LGTGVVHGVVCVGSARYSHESFEFGLMVAGVGLRESARGPLVVVLEGIVTRGAVLRHGCSMRGGGVHQTHDDAVSFVGCGHA